MMKHVRRTLKKCFRQKQGRLLFAGMFLGLAIAIIAASGLVPQKQTTLVAMIGVVVSMLCGNGFAQLVTIFSQSHDDEE